MKRIFYLILCCFMFVFVSCSQTKEVNAIELMGAGDHIHDSFTFANVGVEISNKKNEYLIFGSVEKLTDEKIKKEFDIDESVTHVVAIKLSSLNEKVEKENLRIVVDGVENYDAEHLNGMDYTFIILEAIPKKTVEIGVKWNGKMNEKKYIIVFDEDLILK